MPIFVIEIVIEIVIAFELTDDRQTDERRTDDSI